MTGENDISPCLSWCEERIIAMSEAIVVDSGKPAAHINTTDDQQPLYARQAQLATLVQGMMGRSISQQAAAEKVCRYLSIPLSLSLSISLSMYLYLSLPLCLSLFHYVSLFVLISLSHY